MKGLLARVEQAGESMPRLAFHGGPPEIAKIVQDFYLHDKDYEMPLYVASPMKRAEDANSRLADVMSSFNTLAAMLVLRPPVSFLPLMLAGLRCHACTLPDYLKRLPYLEQLETQRQAHALLQAIGL
ncbi:hypothetical protein KBI23_25310 [bacterium]|nr:hypothetical protein [bacterium]MBP9811596.1 hypothetical protein [bacterium]